MRLLRWGIRLVYGLNEVGCVVICISNVFGFSVGNLVVYVMRLSCCWISNVGCGVSSVVFVVF